MIRFCFDEAETLVYSGPGSRRSTYRGLCLSLAVIICASMAGRQRAIPGAAARVAKEIGDSARSHAGPATIGYAQSSRK
jgi:hypothetical protein